LRVRKAFKDLGICNAIDLEEWQVRGEDFAGYWGYPQD
jgi:hypothetical protein